MRRYDLIASARHALREWCARMAPSDDRSFPAVAVGALLLGMILSTALLAATDSRTPVVLSSPDPGGVTESPNVGSSARDAFTLHLGSDTDRDANFEDVTVEVLDAQSDEIRWFNNRPIRPVKTVRMLVTAYSPDEQSCGEWADGYTASGYSVWTNGMKLVAADTSILPFGSLVSIPGYDGGEVVPVLDRGGAIKGNRLDVLYPTHERARVWGAQRLEVTIWEYADSLPNGFRQQHRRR
jgi:3D (Asp-Asp-Asp) domain-containing protein